MDVNLSFKEFEHQGWEKVADAYHDGFSRITSQVASMLVQHAMISKNDKILDIACGPGYVASFAFEKSDAVTGIDFSNAMIQKAKTLYPKINFQVMDAEALQFDDEIFDFALMNLGILHLEKPKKALSEAFRVLKPGGKLLFTVWDKPARSKAFDFIMNALKEVGDLNVPLPEGPDFFKFSDLDATKEILSHLGFDVISAMQEEFIWTLNNAEELFQTFYEGGIRIGGILRAQKAKTVQKIIGHLERHTKPFQIEEKLKIPTSAILFICCKPK